MAAMATMAPSTSLSSPATSLAARNSTSSSSSVKSSFFAPLKVPALSGGVVSVRRQVHGANVVATATSKLVKDKAASEKVEEKPAVQKELVS